MKLFKNSEALERELILAHFKLREAAQERRGLLVRIAGLEARVEKASGMSADLRTLTSDDLLNPTVAQADDCGDDAVAEPPDVGFTDRSVTRLPGRLIAGDGGGELSLGVGHVKKCTENLTESKDAYTFLYMNSYRITTQADTSSKSRQTRTWTIQADDIDDACYEAHMLHIKLVGWNASVWVETAEVMS